MNNTGIFEPKNGEFSFKRDGVLMTFEEYLQPYIDEVEYKADRINFVEKITNAFNKKLVKIDVSRLNIIEFPSCFRALPQLEILNANDNAITNLTPDIGYLSNLNIGYLSNLNELNLHKNKLPTIPKEIGFLKKLQLLRLSDNEISFLPGIVIGELVELVALYLQNNRLKALPKTIGKLAKLLYLYVDNNPLSELPDSLKQIQGLKKFDITKTQITTQQARDLIPVDCKLITDEGQ